ncbi:MAG TPA: RNA polymerase sigma factor [Sphingomicrobium sp.]|jgi:RNA polymerase sigma-70 factor (ECF subfamily)|nr:RNA polymerase sigma factor [Sphingomicrobium sp.]
MTAHAHLDFAALDDVALARLCGRRDREAVRHVVTANNQRLFRAAWSILKDRAEAEEAVQAGYLSAFTAIDKFEGRSSLSTWLTRIVINEALGRLRSQRRRREQLENEGVTLMETYRERLAQASAEPPPDVSVAREQLRLLIERSVADLPDNFRSVFVLREIEGLSVDDTAEALGIPAATVKTRLHRARAKLQQALAPEVKGAFSGSFPFAGADCAAMTERVLEALKLT